MIPAAQPIIGDEEREAVARRIEALEDWGPFKKEQQDKTDGL